MKFWGFVTLMALGMVVFQRHYGAGWAESLLWGGAIFAVFRFLIWTERF